MPTFVARVHDQGCQTEGPAAFRAGSAGNDGVFAQWQWDGSRLVVENDRWGVRPVFVATAPGAIWAGTNVVDLLNAGAPSAIDDGAMAVFLRAGFFVGNDTPFAAIRALPPAGRAVWKAGTLSVESTWRTPQAAAISRRGAVEGFGALLADSVERLANARAEPRAVLLDGGHDSRHVLLAMLERKIAPQSCITVRSSASRGDDGVTVARAVAGAAGLDHVVVDARPDRVAAVLETQPLTSLGSDELAEWLPLRDHLQRAPVHVFDGLAGDVLSQSRRFDRTLHRHFAEGWFEHVADRVLGAADGIEPALSRLLTAPAMQRFTRAAAIARVAAEAARHASAPNPIASFFFSTRMRRELALGPHALLDVAPVSTPFLDRDVVDLLLSLPFELVADRTFHTETLQRRYPAFAHVRYAASAGDQEARSDTRRTAAAFLRAIKDARSALLKRPAIAARVIRAYATGGSRHLWFMPRMLHVLEVERRAAGS